MKGGAHRPLVDRHGRPGRVRDRAPGRAHGPRQQQPLPAARPAGEEGLLSSSSYGTTSMRWTTWAGLDAVTSASRRVMSTRDGSPAWIRTTIAKLGEPGGSMS